MSLLDNGIWVLRQPDTPRAFGRQAHTHRILAGDYSLSGWAIGITTKSNLGILAVPFPPQGPFIMHLLGPLLHWSLNKSLHGDILPTWQYLDF